MISFCPSCSSVAGDELRVRAHQMTHAVSRPHDVSGMLCEELTRARRELRASLGLRRPGSPASAGEQDGAFQVTATIIWDITWQGGRWCGRGAAAAVHDRHGGVPGGSTSGAT
jgi:hypothetical protein